MLNNPHAMLTVSELSVSLSNTQVLDDINFHVSPGCIHALIGPNGAGKTTLMRSLLGQIRHQGTIMFACRHPADIAYVPQQLDFDRHLPLTVADFFHLMLSKKPVFFGRSRRLTQQISSLLEHTQCRHLINHPLSALSGGELRRVMIAQALSSRPKILLMDEPASNMDELAAHAFERLLTKLHKEQHITIIMVAHDLAMVNRIADEVTCINRTLLFTGSIEQFRQRFQSLDASRFAAEWLTSMQIPDQFV